MTATTRKPRLAGGIAGLVLAGAALGACGGDDGGSADRSADGSATTTGTGSSLEFVAVDIDFERDAATAAAGELEVTLTNEGAIEHSWLVEGREDDLRLYTQQAGATDQGTIPLEAGEYTYYCDIPGHREGGMEGTLTIE